MQRPLDISPAEACPELPAIDLHHLSRYTLGDRALEAEVLALFAAQLPAMVDALQGARCDTEWRIAAHTLKGSARAVGAWRLAKLAEHAEQLGQTAAAGETAVIASIAAAAREAEASIAALAADRQPGL